MGSMLCTTQLFAATQGRRSARNTFLCVFLDSHHKIFQILLLLSRWSLPTYLSLYRVIIYSATREHCMFTERTGNVLHCSEHMHQSSRPCFITHRHIK
jgi:hypothetical protein